MGRRTRQRPGAPAPAPPPPPRAPRRRATLDEAPRPPWHPVPLVELAVLVGLVVFVLGLLSEGDRRMTLVLAGIALASLAGLELSIREHFAGYRSHSSLLALATAFAAGIPAHLLGAPRVAVLALASAAALAAFLVLRAAFARRSGGLSWRA